MLIAVFSMNRLSLLLPLFLGAMYVQGQTSSSITISTNPQGPRFQVDGVTYTQAVSFEWPEGSTHYVVFITDPPPAGQTSSSVQTSTDGSTEWTFSGWQDNNTLVQPSSSPVQIITANPAITTFTAQVAVDYRILLNFYGSPAQPITSTNCGAPGPANSLANSPGLVFVGSECYLTSAYIYVPAGSTEPLNAYPYPGYAFIGWNINSSTPSTFLTSVTINSPITIVPMFVPAERVSFLTSPLGMQVLVDHTPSNTRTVSDVPNCPNNETIPVPLPLNIPAVCFGDFYFAPGSTHFISGKTPQMDGSGNWWVFNEFSNAMPQNSLFTAGPANTSAVITANYIPGVQVALVTSPVGLQLSVDGDTNYSSYDFIWGTGTTHTVSAAATQKGSNGRMYTFQNWSNQGAATQTVTPTASMRLTANYNELSRVVLESVPAGLTLQVDGSNCVTPCNVDRASGATFTVSAPTQIPMGSGARLDFNNWSDGGASNHTITMTQNYATVYASYSTLYQLNANSAPGNGSAFKFSPSSSDMFYTQGTQVNVTAMPNPGFKFGHWTGALSGSYPAGSVTLGAPESIVANMISVPYIAPAGIMNAAGVTPSASVAPGSIISIFGQNLASVVQLGPVNPFAQSIGGTTVTIDDLILPLMFVSPTQINAQLPSELPDGNYTLEVQNIGQDEISGNLKVARDAPGLFSNIVGSTYYATAFHSSGAPITTSSPAAAGETISFLGTGFGPYRSAILDGFFPPNPPPTVADSVALTVGGQKVSSKSTAAPGFAGIVSTSFEVPSGLSGSAVPLQVSINGVDSNTVILPVQ